MLQFQWIPNNDPTYQQIPINEKKKFNTNIAESRTGLLALWVDCSPMAREIWVQSQVESYQRLKKMEQDAALLNKVRIKGKLDQYEERSSALLFKSVW